MFFDFLKPAFGDSNKFLELVKNENPNRELILKLAQKNSYKFSDSDIRFVLNFLSTFYHQSDVDYGFELLKALNYFQDKHNSKSLRSLFIAPSLTKDIYTYMNWSTRFERIFDKFKYRGFSKVLLMDILYRHDLLDSSRSLGAIYFVDRVYDLRDHTSFFESYVMTSDWYSYLYDSITNKKKRVLNRLKDRLEKEKKLTYQLVSI